MRGSRDSGPPLFLAPGPFLRPLLPMGPSPRLALAAALCPRTASLAASLSSLASSSSLAAADSGNSALSASSRSESSPRREDTCSGAPCPSSSCSSSGPSSSAAAAWKWKSVLRSACSCCSFCKAADSAKAWASPSKDWAEGASLKMASRSLLSCAAARVSSRASCCLCSRRACEPTCSCSSRSRSARSRTTALPVVRASKSFLNAASSCERRSAKCPTVRPPATRRCHWASSPSAAAKPAV
mmetsp:Transcript_21363/g.29390  ORF Transcript_21363/g.29390 Transcript_21363/m.29390 type:complete len:242 (+) Transcript_21363:322-1047(+)